MKALSGTTTLLLCLALLWPPLSISVAQSARASPGIAYTLNGALWTVHADGNHSHRLTRPGVAYGPELSPDGGLIAYDRIAAACSPPRPPGSDGPAPMPNLLTVVSASGHGRRWSTCGNGSSWSPDSRLLAYFNREGLTVRSFDGRDPRTLLEPDRMYGYVGAIWSPDSLQMAVPLYGPGSGLFSDRTLRLAIVPLHSPVRRIVIRFPTSSLGPNSWGNPYQSLGSFPTYSHLTWTSDGHHLLVETLSNANVSRLTGIWEVSSNGGIAHLVSGTVAGVQGRVRPIPALDHATGFTLSPDGKKLATNPHGLLWVGDLAGDHGRFLVAAGCLIRQAQWLADSSGVAYIASCTHGTTSLLVIVRLTQPISHVLVRSGPQDTDLNSFL